MTRARRTIIWTLSLLTFGWLLLADISGGPAVLWPSFLAVVLAFVGRDIYLALFLSALSGAVLLREGNVFTAFLDLFSQYLLPALVNPWNASVLVFTLMMGGLVEVLNRGGGMKSLIDLVLGNSMSHRRVGVGAYLVGWLLFFDGLANSMLVGKTMRSLADRVKMSREKLAFIVDSTSSPIAGLALISTWVTYEMSQIKAGFEQVGNEVLMNGLAPYQLLIESLPYRFYNYFILLIVFLVVWRRLDIGPMKSAEALAAKNERRNDSEESGRSVATASPWVAVVPLLLLVVGVFGGLYIEGGGLEHGFSVAGFIKALGNSNAALVFVWATAAASLAAIVLAGFGRGADSKEGPLHHFLDGMKQMFLPGLILVLAWTLNGVIKELGTAKYLVSLIGDGLGVAWLPMVVFILASIVSFSTGTSWGTMAIVMPLVIPLAVAMTGIESATDPGQLLLAVIGAVLAGAVFGDHCSPISDTTIVSAFSSGCDPVAHVRTQLPYAGIAGVLAVVVGYGPSGMGVSPWLLLGVGILGLVGWAFLGKPAGSTNLSRS